MVKMHCPVCKKEYQEDDLVCLDDINTVRHLHCSDREIIYKDARPFKEMIYKYDFFKKLRDNVKKG